MATDKEIARNASIHKQLHTLQKQYGYDGVILLAYSHTDEGRNMTDFSAGQIPPMDEVVYSLVRLAAQTAYMVGKRDAEAEADVKLEGPPMKL